MKKEFYNLGTYLLCIILFGCTSDELATVSTDDNKVTVTFDTELDGSLYVDGKYIEKGISSALNLTKGNHLFSLGIEGMGYYRKEVNSDEENTLKIQFLETDRVPPKIWKALWIGVPGAFEEGGCSTSISNSDLDLWYNYFLWSLNIIESNSYNSISWDVNRIDFDNKALLTNDGTYKYISWETVLNTLSANVDFSSYDNVFVFWPKSTANTGSCSYKSPYFGLAWGPQFGFGSGFVNVKNNFDTGTVEEEIFYYKNSDPGVWVHEWLHTVAEDFYPSLGYTMPSVSGQGVVHSAEEYGYSDPWMNWYQDIIQAKVVSKEGLGERIGIGPEALWSRSIKK